MSSRGIFLRFLGIVAAVVFVVPIGWVIQSTGDHHNILTPGLWATIRIPFFQSLDFGNKTLVWGIVNGICFYAVLLALYLAVRRFRRARA